jgi:hypothetical protein
VVAWLQDDVLQRLVPPKGLRKGPKQRVRRPSQLELAMEGPRLSPRSKRAGAGAGCLDAVDAVSSSSDSEDLEGSNGL